MKRIIQSIVMFLVSACVYTSAQSTSSQKHVLPDSFYNPAYDYLGQPRTYWGRSTDNFSLDLRDSCTILTFCLSIDSSYQEVWVGGDETFILDMSTGARYAALEALRGAKLNAYNIVTGHKGERVFFQIRFPRLREYPDGDINTGYVKIYGVPEAGLNGGQEYRVDEIRCLQIKDWNRFSELENSPLLSYEDSKPLLKQPRIVSNKRRYVSSDTATYKVFSDLPKVYPLTLAEMESGSVALWTTPQATYLTQIVEIKHFRTVIGLRKSSIELLIPKVSGDARDSITLSRPTDVYELYDPVRPISAAPYPLEENFIVDAIPGDFVVLTIEFPPLPIGTNRVSVFIRTNPDILIPSQKEEMFFGKEMTVGVWRDNQRLVRPLIATERIER